MRVFQIIGLVLGGRLRLENAFLPVPTKCVLNKPVVQAYPKGKPKRFGSGCFPFGFFTPFWFLLVTVPSLLLTVFEVAAKPS